MLVCVKCGSPNVSILAWVDVNSNEYQGEGPGGQSYCEDCYSEEGVREETSEEKQERIEAINYLNQVNSKLKF